MEGEETIAKRGRGRGRGSRGGATRARGRGRGRGRGRKASRVIESDDDASPEQQEPFDIDISSEEKSQEEVQPAPFLTYVAVPFAEEKENEVIPPPTIDMEADISQLEAPTFTTISRGPPEPMLRLKWDHKVSLIGEKVLNPMIHCCDQCEKPILIYGRMIPCKHVFCLRCARLEPIKICPRCKEKVLRVEQSGLGTVFMCTFGGSRYGNTGCRRTYLSQRDLQAHINHRHVTPMTLETKSAEGKTATQRKISITNDPLVNRPSSNRSNPIFGAGAIGEPSPQATASTVLQHHQHHHHHHQQPPQTIAQDLTNYFNATQNQYGQSTSYATISQQSSSTQQPPFASAPINLSQQPSVHNLSPVATSSTSFYSSYGQYNLMQTPPQNLHYSNANRSSYDSSTNAYQTTGGVQSTNVQQLTSIPQSQHTHQQQQQSWQQPPYYR